MDDRMATSALEPSQGLSPSRLKEIAPRRPTANGYPVAAILGGMVFVALVGAYAARQGKILQIGIPLWATGVAISVRKKPRIYLQWTIWTWLLIAFLRRIIDLRCGFANQSLVLLTPLPVTLVCLSELWPRRSKIFESKSLLPFVLCLYAGLFGGVVSLMMAPSARAVYALIEWEIPILFGLYLAAYSERFELYRAVFQQTFLAALLLLGSYGIFQFVVMPRWDVFWLENIIEVADQLTFGRPEPGMLRVWSTVNSPGHFATLCFVAIAIVILYRSKWKIPAILLGIVNLGLTLIRTAWGGFAVSLFLLLFTIRRKSLLGILAVGVVAGCCLPLLTLIPGVSDVVSERLKTITNIQADDSYNDRKETYQKTLGTVLSNPLGTGHMGGELIDSGILDLCLCLGWPGALVYVGSVLALLANPRSFRLGKDDFSRSCQAAAVGVLFLLPSGNSLIELPGLLLWACTALYRVGCDHAVEQQAALQRANEAESKVPVGV
jgi:hypothetical protein